MMYRAAFVHEQSVLVVDDADNSAGLSDIIVVGNTWRGLRWPRGTGWRPRGAYHRWIPSLRVARSPGDRDSSESTAAGHRTSRGFEGRDESSWHLKVDVMGRT